MTLEELKLVNQAINYLLLSEQQCACGCEKAAKNYDDLFKKTMAEIEDSACIHDWKPFKEGSILFHCLICKCRRIIREN